MYLIVRFFYSYIILTLLFLAYTCISIFNYKYREALIERFKILKTVKSWRASVTSEQKVVLIHAASMGEFEHIKPIIYEISNQKNSRIVLTFFSPSGYKHIKNYPGIDLILYSPLDFKNVVKKFYKILDPKIIIISKHDAWPNQVWMAREMNIKIFLVNASLTLKSSRVRPWVVPFLKYVYDSFDEIFMGNIEDEKLFKKFYPNSRLNYSGDTKFDQVLVRKELSRNKHYFDSTWTNNCLVFIAGSIWKEDAQVLFPVMKKILAENRQLIIILVPHQPETSIINLIYDSFGSDICKKYSEKGELKKERILVVDVIGILADLYKYAHIAYVGGSFKQGIHNVMEPAVYGIPVIYGPEHQNSTDAIKLIDSGGSYACKTGEELLSKISSLISNESFRISSGEKAYNYAMTNLGATQKIMEHIKSFIE